MVELLADDGEGRFCVCVLCLLYLYTPRPVIPFCIGGSFFFFGWKGWVGGGRVLCIYISFEFGWGRGCCVHYWTGLDWSIISTSISIKDDGKEVWHQNML